MNETRFTRQLDVFDPAQISMSVTIIGAGATGSFTALTLAKMGVRNISVYDFDTVEEHNLPNQFYRTCDLGKPKVIALREIIEQFEGISIIARNEKYKGQRLQGIVIVAVDSMDTRIHIWKFAKQNPDVKLFIDSRMGLEVIRLYSFDPNDFYGCKEYESTLYPSSEAIEVRCTAKTIMYTVLSIASLLSNQVKKFLTGELLKKELLFDLKTVTLIS
ncbi:MAG: ThiF family adenylyltransferase [Bacteroidetes bacterium]|nr:MAG: ThiF family adenylyltransferase [Bacteroidota bacterium]